MFSAEWLSLREPADAAARSEALTQALAETLPRDRSLRVLDLAAGTGANARFLVERLHRDQDWSLVDHDAALLDELPGRMAVWANAHGSRIDRRGESVDLSLVSGKVCRITTHCADLSTLDGFDLVGGRDLVTASALLDLVSESWLRQLAHLCSQARATALFALTYDGRIECEPVDSDDDIVRDLVNRHQRIDKGFGPALGPTAVDAARRIFSDAGYTVRRAVSDWTLGPEAKDLQRQLIEGWAAAARDIDGSPSSTIERWRARRLAHVDRPASRLIVGHEDLLALRRD